MKIKSYFSRITVCFKIRLCDSHKSMGYFFRRLFDIKCLQNKPSQDLDRLKRQNEKLRHSQNSPLESSDSPTIYLITPTYARHTQKADLTRLLYTLMHVKKLHWVLVEDSDSKTDLITRKCLLK